mgnify:CR=1 FL=1
MLDNIEVDSCKCVGMTMFNYIDLFAGAGGLSEGFISSGYNPVAHVEMNPDACLTLKTRACYHYLKKVNRESVYYTYLKGLITRDELYSSVPDSVLNSVINETMSEANMPELHSKIRLLMEQQDIKSIDLIVGGPPCQAYSIIGRAVKGENIKNDPRNYLYRVYLQVLGEFRPKMFVFENVPGLLTANRGKYFGDIKAAFDEAGYNLDYRTLNARNFNVLQNRQRVILIGWQKKYCMQYPAFEEIQYPYTVNDIFEDLPPILAGEENNKYLIEAPNEYLAVTGIRKPNDILTWHIARPINDRDKDIYRTVISAWNEDKRRIKYTDLPSELRTHRNMTAFLDRFKVIAPDLPASQTLVAHISKDGHYYIHPDIHQARSISVREAARIQSFPDDYYFEGSRTAAFTQIGNAVPPLMAKGIAAKLKKKLELPFLV